MTLGSVEGIPPRDTVVKFTAQFASYFPGEQAAFTSDEAQALGDQGVIDTGPPPTPTAAFLTGGAVADPVALLDTLVAIVDAGFAITIGGTVFQVGPGDLAGFADLQTIAAIITAAFGGAGAGARCDWSDATRRFTITTTATGPTATIGYASAPAAGTDIAVDCQLTAATGATLTQGTAGS